MQELLRYIKQAQWQQLFFEATTNQVIKMFRYLFVGGFSFVADYLVFVLIGLVSGNGFEGLFIAITGGFIAGLMMNFHLSKLFVFTDKSVVQSGKVEFIIFAVIGIVGWLISILLMGFFTKFINKYIAKLIIALIVLVYNYGARQYILYSGRNKK